MNSGQTIAVLPGDGIGPEVMDEALRVLDYIDSHGDHRCLRFDRKPWGSDYYRRTGQMMPAGGLQDLATYDALLFGAVGRPDVPDHVTLREFLLRIRFAFDQYINFRPATLLEGIASPIGLAPPLEIAFIREGVEGEYCGAGGRMFEHTERDTAVQTSVFTRTGIERVLRWSFDHARATGKSLTSVSKGNALQYTGVLWDEVFRDVAARYPDVPSRNLLVDAAAMLLVREPASFEVVVASNLFADILTDLAAALVGGLGMAPSASLNPERAFPSTFEPVHGSAPDIAGRGIANPIGMIWSAALMLGHLGHPNWQSAILGAIRDTLADPALRTRDLGGTAGTRDIGAAVVAALADRRSELMQDLASPGLPTHRERTPATLDAET
jgi:tartrate dehydrogenase/decarboxylase / D-malate dehydrogenase